METAVQVFAVIHLGLMGLSHVVQHAVWADFFIRLREMGHAGVFAHGFLSLIFGSVIVAFHPVWSGIPVVLTVLGWAFVAKAALCFLLPAVSMRSLMRVSAEQSRRFMVPGVAFLLVAALLAYHLVVS